MMSKAIAVLFIAVLSVTICLGQTSLAADSLLQKGIFFSKTNLDSALSYLDRAETTAFREEAYNLGMQVLKWKVQCAVDLSKYASQRTYLQQLDTAYQRYFSCLVVERQQALAIDIRAMWAGYFLRVGPYDRALATNLEVIDLLRQKPNLTARDSFLIFRSQAFVAQLHKNVGNYDAAIQHYWEAISYIRSHRGQVLMGRIGLCYSQMGICYARQSEEDRAEAYFRKAIDELQQYYPASDPETQFRLNKNLLVCFHNLADYYLDRGQTEAAIRVLKQCEQLEKNPLMRTTEDLLGKAYTQQQNWTLARHHLQSALTLKQNQVGAQHHLTGETLHLMGQLAVAQGNLPLAQAHFQAVIAAHGQLAANDWTTVFGRLQLMETLIDLAALCYDQFRQTGDRSILQQGEATAQRALELMDVLRASVDTDWDKQLMLDRRYRLFELALQIGAALQPTNRAQLFELAEQSKAAVLRDGLRYARQKAMAAIPSDLLERETQIRETIAELRIQLEQSPQSERSLRKQLFQYRQNYLQLQSELEQRYLSQYPLTTKRFTLADAQALLGPKQAAIEYFLGDSMLYTFLLTRDSIQVWKDLVPSQLSTTIEGIRQQIMDPERRQSVGQLEALSTNLYDWLLRKPLQQLPPEVDQLTIVPDGILHLVPFEALPHTLEAASNPNYLVERFRVHYAYSLTLIREQQESIAHPSAKVFAGFAPDFQHDLPPLRGALEQVRQTAEQWRGDAFTHNQASETEFRRVASAYRIYLLATHALIDDRQPRLFFTSAASEAGEDDVLNVDEIYTLQMDQADLVVLASCNSGSGQLHRGEGMISLARAFAYLGVSATVMSLWRAPEAATADIMRHFFEQLQNGHSKDEALRLAKLRYLSKQKGALARHPYFWAGFIVHGDPTPLKKATSIWTYWGWFLLVPFFVLSGWWLLRSKNRL